MRFASCTAKCPVPPAAAVTSTVSLGFISPVTCSPTAAVTPEMVSATTSAFAAGTL
jgi:hypothetical protein